MQVKENADVSNFLMAKSPSGNGSKASKADKKIGSSDFTSFLISAGNRNTDRNDVELLKDTKKQTADHNSSVSVTDTADDLKDADSTKQTELSKDDKVSEREDDSKPTDSLKEPDDTKQTDAVEDSDDTKTEDSVETTPAFPIDVTVEDQETVLAALGSIIQMVMEHFELVPEELTAKLNEFGMEMTDLLTKTGLKEFFLNMKSADFSDLLVNEELNQELQTFMDGFSQILEQHGLQEEDLVTVLQGMDAGTLLTKESGLQEFVKEKDSEQSDDLSIASEKVEKEPEVLISGQETKLKKDMEKQPEHQKEDASSQMAGRETEPVKDTVTVHRENFENPILQAMDDAVSHIQESVMAEEPVPENNIIKQIVEQVRISMNQDSTSMELQLYPEHLGKIQIHVVSKDGVMTARIAAETEAAKQAIEGGLSNLKDTLEQQNLKVEAIEVMVSTTGFEQQNEQQNSYQENQGSKRGRKLDLSGMDDDIQKEDEAENLKMAAAGSSVSYTA